MITISKRRLAIATLLLLFVPPVLAEELPTARPDQVGLSSEKLRRIRPALERLVKDGKMAGAVTLVARHGRVVCFDVCGMRDIAAGKPMTRDTIFRIYSMTKPITTVAAMMLWEEGRFKLDDPVTTILPEFKDLEAYRDPEAGASPQSNPARPMTIRDLMRHTSGLTYGLFGNTPVDQLYRERKVLDRRGTLQDMVRKLGKIPLVHPPGTTFRYSVAADVLGRVIEVVSNKRFDVFLKERIFEPLDMKDTDFYVPAEKLDRLAANYRPTLSGELGVVVEPASSRYAARPSFLSGGGGLVSTARDYARFCQMMLNGGQLQGKRLLCSSTVAMMTTNQLPKEAMPIAIAGFKKRGLGFGLGFSVRLAESRGDPGAMVGEYAWGGAASTHFWISPKDDLIVIAMEQYMPRSARLERAIRPIVHDAIKDRGQ